MSTEREKRARGELYMMENDPSLVEEFFVCKDMCQEYNLMKYTDIEGRTAKIKEILGKTGEWILVMSPFMCDYGYNIEVGEHFLANHGCTILDCGKVTFGDYVYIAPNCDFYAAGHPIDAETRKTGLEYARPITVGNNVWIGGGCRIMGGVTIGDNAVIASGSVVTKDIPPNTLAAGNPCQVIRNLTPAEGSDTV